MKGNPEQGINQPDKTFDYEPFIPPESPTQFQNATKNRIGSLFGEIIDGDDSPGDSSSESSSDYSSESSSESFDESNSRESPRFKRNIQTVYDTFIKISGVDTICPDETRQSYESNGLSCTDLRKVNI